MKKNICLIILTLITLSCSKNLKFTVEGNIEGGDEEMLYLEQIDDSKTTLIDSVELSRSGKYKFKAPKPAYPSFYRLRLNNQSILFAIDSCEKIQINSQKEKFATNYSIDNSPNSENIQKLRNSIFDIQHYRDKSLADNTFDNQKLGELIDKHKELAQKIILGNTQATAAYYAINQTIDGYYIFSPYNKNDLRYWSAVATAFQAFQPNNPRTEKLTTIVLGVLREKQQAKANYDRLENPQKVGAIEMSLPNRVGEQVKLSSLQGKVVLIDFSAYETATAPQHTLFLRDLYNTYQNDGFEIYQVSLDANKLLWLEQTRQIPWICVRDTQAPNCKYILAYNITEIPAWFLVDRNGDIVAGKELTDKNLSISIEKLLTRE